MDRDFIDVLPLAVRNLKNIEDKILNETLHGYFPDINEKEFIICEGICSFVHDQQFSPDEEILIPFVLRDMKKDKIFSDEDEVKKVIKGLLERRIIICEASFRKSPVSEGFIRCDRFLSLSGYLDEEIAYWWRKEFEYAIKGTSYVHKNQNQ